MSPTKLQRDTKAVLWKEKQKFGPTLSLYTREDAANQNYLYFVVKSFKEGAEANMDIEGEEGTGRGGFISFLEGPKEENYISGQITAGKQDAGEYPLFLDTCFDPERGIAISGGFASYIIWALAFDFSRMESVLLNRNREIILSDSELGQLVTKSHLKEVGKLDYLDVGGNVVIDAGLTVNGTSVLKGVLAESIFATTYYNLPPLNPAQLTPFTLDAANFRVGISNPVPQYALDVFGDVNVSGNFLVNGQPLQTDLAPITLDKTNNRVGINDTTPNVALDVTGHAHITETLDAGNLASRGQLLVVGDTTLSANLEVKGGAGIDGDLAVLGDTTLFNANVLGKVSTGTLAIAAPTNAITENTLYYDTTTKEVSYGSAPTSDISPITLDKTNNRVGINNSAPTAALDVTGQVNVTETLRAGSISSEGLLYVKGFTILEGLLDSKSDIATQGSFTVLGDSTLFNANVLGSLESGTLKLGAIVNSSKSNVLMYDTTTKEVSYGSSPAPDIAPITLDKVNNRVGINFANPSYTLGVGGDANLATGGVYRINGNRVLALKASDTTLVLGLAGIVPDTSTNSVCVGTGANVAANGVSVGYNAGALSQKTGSVSIGANAGRYSQGQTCVAIGNNAGTGSTTAGTGQGNSAVAIGLDAGTNTQGLCSVAVGPGAAETTQGQFSVAVGFYAGRYTQANNAVAIGPNAGAGTATVGTGQGTNAVAIGNGAGSVTQGSQSLAIGNNAGNSSQGANAFALGASAGRYTQGGNAIAIGTNAGQTTQGEASVAIGLQAAETSQLGNAVAIGSYAGRYNQASNSVAIGPNAGAGTTTAGTGQGAYAVAIGADAGLATQGTGGVAIGAQAGQSSQKTCAVAIGMSAGDQLQGQHAIAIGFSASRYSQGDYSIAIGSKAGGINPGAGSTQPANSIAINATGLTLVPNGASRFHVKPVRQNTAAPSLLGYDATSGEITYGALGGFQTTTTTESFGNPGASGNVTASVTLSTAGTYQITVEHWYTCVSPFTVTGSLYYTAGSGVLSLSGFLGTKTFAPIQDSNILPPNTYAVNDKWIGNSVTFSGISAVSAGSFVVTYSISNQQPIPANTFTVSRKITVVKFS